MVVLLVASECTLIFLLVPCKDCVIYCAYHNFYINYFGFETMEDDGLDDVNQDY